MYMCIYTYIRMHIYIYISDIYISISIYLFIYLSICLSIYLYKYIYIVCHEIYILCVVRQVFSIQQKSSTLDYFLRSFIKLLTIMSGL